MNLEQFGRLSFLYLRNGRLLTELGDDVTDEVIRIFQLPESRLNMPIDHQEKPQAPLDH